MHEKMDYQRMLSLSQGDNLDSRTPIAFVGFRNKIAHGEIAHLVTDLNDYDLFRKRNLPTDIEKTESI